MRSNSNTPKYSQHSNAVRSTSDRFCVLPWGYIHAREYRTPMHRSATDAFGILIAQLPEQLLVRSEVQNVSGASPDANGAGLLMQVAYETRAPENGDGIARSGIFKIISRFARFEGSRAVTFGLERSDTEGAANPREILLRPATTINEFTVALQWYERRWASLFGLFPVATRTLDLTVSETELVAAINVQRQASKTSAAALGEAIYEEFISPIL